MTKLVLPLALLLAVLTGCAGSGGGGRAQPPAPNPDPIQPPPTTRPDPVDTIADPGAGDPSSLVVSPCDEALRGFVDDPANTSFDPCHRARIPGLAPLYRMTSANISERMAAAETFPKTGVVIDGLDCRTVASPPPGFRCMYGPGDPDHGDLVVETVNIAAPPELFLYSEVSAYKQDTVNKFRELADMANGGGLVANPVVNISQSNLFATNAAAAGSRLVRRDLINPEDVLNSKALLVVPTGNYGERDTTVNPGGSSELRTTPDQPAHNGDALREIHELTESILLVAGLDDSSGLPLTDADGFHEDYTSDTDPKIHRISNRCGDTQDYCVAAPYTIFNSVRSVEEEGGRVVYKGIRGNGGTSFSSALVSGTLMNLRYVWPHLTNPQLVKLSCATATDLGEADNDPVYGCGRFSVSDIWQPTGKLVDNPEETFSLSVADGGMSVGGASFDEEVRVVGYENNEFRRDYEISAPASSSGTPLRVEPTVSYRSLRTMLRFRGNGSVPVGYEGTAAHLFKGAFLFLKGVHGGSAVGVSHASGFSVAFERETDSFFGSYGSGSYKFGDTNKVVASFDREFDINGTYGLGVKVAAAYGEMEPAISLVKSAKGTAKSAGLSLARKKGNFESRVEMNYNTGLKGTVSIQRREYDLKPLSEAAVMLRMRFVM